MATRRKNTKDATVIEATPATAEAGISMILETEPQKTIEDAALIVGCAPIKLLEMFRDRLNNAEAMAWDSIPVEHEPLLDEFKRQLESEASVRRLTPPQEETPQIPAQPEPPVLKEEPAFQITSKRKTSGITNKRKKSIGKQLQNIETIDLGIDNAEALNLVRDAAADGVELGQAQVLAKESARLSVRRKAYERTTAKLKEKAVKRAEYDPTDLLKQAGLQVSDDLLEDLQEFSEVSLGKFQTVFEEVTGDVWGNGYTNDFSDLDTQLDWSE